MSYLVLARKYRPQRFADLVGQEHVARTLTNAIELDRVHHAFLFTGARGVGKTSAARILAKALCCASGPTAIPCGTCDFCVEIAGGQSVDVLEIDGASNTGVDDVRTLRDSVRYLPSKGRRKVYIIDEVHMLSTNAFNALLKTLEEPPPHVVFILATTEVHKIPTTILSRCQRYDFKLIPTARLVEHLGTILDAESIAFEPDGVRLCARQAAGSVRDALSLLDQVIAFVGKDPLTHARVADVLGIADRTLLSRMLDLIVARDAPGVLRALDGAANRGVDLAQLGRAFLTHLHDVEIATVVADPSDILDITPDELVEAKAVAARAGQGLFSALFDRWARALDESARSPVPRLILEMALLDLCAAEPLLPLGDLLKRLEELEGRLTDGGAPGARAPGSTPTRRPVSMASAPANDAVADSPPTVHAPVLLSRAATALAVADRVVFAPRPVTAEDTWRLVRLRFEDRPSIAASLDHAEIGAFEQGRVVLRAGDKLLVDRLEKYRPVLEQALADVTGGPVRVVIEEAKTILNATMPTRQSEVGREADAHADEKKRRTDEARAHPVIQRAQEIFGVNARETKLL